VNNSCYREIENALIPVAGGHNLTARIWLPVIAASSPVPAILEYLPYRKRDATAPRDESTYPAFAAAGYAGVRVDISGTGESDGEFDDEYSPRELADGLRVIQWIADQPWCCGSVGMMGISWGGFNSLQLAALRPPALKAVIAIGTTVDRYNDDIHYKNGCHLSSNFTWSSTMLCFASRPPDPLLAGDGWRTLWQQRLDSQPFPLEHWLSHQRRDQYWKHGSICEDYNAIQIPSLVISGWCDGYINAPPAMAEKSTAISKAINGPWTHKYPHFALPHPRMDFIGEALSWWDQWLKGIDSNREKLPAYRAFISEDVKPGTVRLEEAGRWVAEQKWPSPDIQQHCLYPGPAGHLQTQPGIDQTASICSPQDCGTGAGEFFPNKPDAELSGDQRHDDFGSLTFDTDPLNAPVEILGRPELKLQLSIDRPLGNIVVRLNDIRPDGSSHRVSWGALNLSHRLSNEKPELMQPGVSATVQLVLNECGYRFLPGHRIRVAISTAYWPMISPPPEVVTASIALGRNTCLSLPVRHGGDQIGVSPPHNPDPLPQYPCLSEPSHHRTIERDLQENVTRYHIFDDTGEHETPGHGMRIRHTHKECFSISPADPLSYQVSSTYTCYMSRHGWNIHTVSESTLRCDKENYYLNAVVAAWEGTKQLNQRHWSRTIPRDFT